MSPLHEHDLSTDDFIQHIKELEICDQNCAKATSCRKLHICAQFVYSGMCLYAKVDNEQCRFGHYLNTQHNSYVLKEKGLENLTIESLRDIHLQTRRNIKSVPICSDYNSKVNQEYQHKEAECTGLHVCYRYLYERCMGEPCSLSHELTDERSKDILKHYGIRTTETLHEDFERMQNCPNIEVIRFLRHFVGIERIESGGYGVVYKATHVLDRQTYAVKLVRLRPEEVMKAKKESEIIAKLKHKNIVRYFNSWVDKPLNMPSVHQDQSNYNVPEDVQSENTYLYIQMEYCDEKTLETIVYKAEKFEYPLQTMFRQIVDAVEYIHSENIVHGDLKPTNIFFERESNNVKVGDFGNSVNFSGNGCLPGLDACTTSSGKRDFKEFNKNGDIYSLGLIALKMFCKLEQECKFRNLVETATENRLEPQVPNISPKMVELIYRMLNVNNTEEPITAKELQIELQTDRGWILELPAELDQSIPEQAHTEE